MKKTAVPVSCQCQSGLVDGLRKPWNSPVRWHWTSNGVKSRPVFCALYLVLFVLFMLITVLEAQSCSSNRDCYPSSSNLLHGIDSAFPSRSLDVSSTCGEPNVTTEYTKNSLTLDFTKYVCNASNIHPAKYMFDRQNITVSFISFEQPILQTYWQSLNSINAHGAKPTEQTVSLNINATFLIRVIKAVFISPHITSKKDKSDMRPLAMVFEKRVNETGVWEPLRYYAKNCSASFPGVTVQAVDGTGMKHKATTAVCMERYFGGDTTTYTGWGFGRQQVIFNPTLDYRAEFATSFAAQSHFLASAVQLRLSEPRDKQPLSSYFAVADLEVDGQCACFGHASVCTGKSGAECQCQHNTMGDHCRQCKPLYNNKAWRMGADGKANACEDCKCNGHAVSCHYDEVKGYGVCDDCQFHTTGDKCQFCVKNFYVNPGKDSFNATTDAWVCSACNCSVEGSLASSDYSCDNSTGQCFCKANVMGRACDQCKDTFWNLTAANPDGCRTCSCDLRGTFNNTNLCDKTTGDCICKKNTQGRTCDQCKVGSFQISLSKIDGCTQCACDPGAATNMTCPVNTGRCRCRRYISGRQCNQPIPGFYGPRLDHLTFEAEFAINASRFETVERPGHGDLGSNITGRGFLKIPKAESLQFIVKVPASKPFELVARYESQTAWVNVKVSLQPTINGTNTVYACNGKNYTTAAPIQRTTTIPVASSKGAVTISTVCLKENLDYTLTITLPGGATGANLLLDSIVLLPVIKDMEVYTSASNQTKAIMDKCYQASRTVDVDLRANLSCAQYGYSIMTQLYDGAIGCVCNPQGSRGIVCAGVGGQCPCKAGVMLRDCRQCKVNYYGFNSGNGCLACNCHPTGSVRLACHENGTCECKANVTGIKCDSCIPQHYGLYTGQGCSKCQCDMKFSLNNSCADSGQCHCKAGVGGMLCNQCLDGFFNLTSDGCTPCGCHPDGSKTPACNKVTGICSCKLRATGTKCDSCTQGYFGLGKWSRDGCLQCFCSGHSNNCTSASGWFQTQVKDTWNLKGQTAVQAPWKGVDDQGRPAVVSHPSVLSSQDAQFVMRMKNSGPNLMRDNLYFSATSRFLGDKRSAYAQTFLFYLAMVIPPPPPNTTVQMTTSTQGDVILKGAHTGFTLVTKMPHYPNSTRTKYEFRLHESDWQVNRTDGPKASYMEMAQTLAELGALLIRAKFTNASNAQVDLYSATLYYALPSNVSNIPINSIEQCVCPIGYAGQFCEKCGPGFRRQVARGGIFSQCVPCSCNGHSTSVPCDSETGTCNCTHNTTGQFCDLCRDGFYGNPKIGKPTDCKPCMCPGNVVNGDVNVFAKTCEMKTGGGHKCHNCTKGHGGDQCEVCVKDWYGVPTDPNNNGGKCVGCKCNTRAITCNTTTGICVDCRNNTAGKECDICAPKYYGNAMTYSCKECNCTLPGATGLCDHRTGQCVCRPNAQGFKCDSCLPNTYNYTSGQGCFPCECHTTGSLGPSCDVRTGQCTCRPRVTGRACDKCVDMYWQINNITGCNPCQCTTAGSANITGETFGKCNLTTGQCTCSRPGTIGRTCDHCAEGTLFKYKYVQGVKLGAYPKCELCGECFDSWAKKIDEVGVAIQQQYNKVLVIWTHYDNLTSAQVEPILAGIRANITSTKSSILKAKEMVLKLNYLTQGFQMIENEVLRLGNITDIVAGHVQGVQALFAQSKKYTGQIALPGTTPKTAEQILNETVKVQKDQTDNFLAAKTSWANIQNMTDTIRRSNGTAMGLIGIVAAAMRVLAKAQLDRQAADKIIFGDFPAGYQNNTIVLEELNKKVSNVEKRIANDTRTLREANQAAANTNTTIHNAEAKVQERAAEMKQKLEESQIVTFNASQANRATAMAQSASNTYKDLATSTKTNMTKALLDIVKGLGTVKNIQNQTGQVTTLTQEVMAIQLRPLSDMVNLTSQINQTAISQADVNKTYASATRGLQVAQEALNITKRAADESHLALSEVKNIQHNLESAATGRNNTDYLVNVTNDYTKTIEDIITQVNNKAKTASSLGNDTTNAINILLGDITKTEQCFVDKKTRIEAAKNMSTTALATANQAAQVQTRNTAQLSTLTKEVGSAKGQTDSGYAQMKTAESDMNKLNNDLRTAQQITNLQGLLTDFTSQKTEITTLSRQLGNLESELNVLLAALNRLDPDSATCTHN